MSFMSYLDPFSRTKVARKHLSPSALYFYCFGLNDALIDGLNDIFKDVDVYIPPKFFLHPSSSYLGEKGALGIAGTQTASVVAKNFVLRAVRMTSGWGSRFVCMDTFLRARSRQSRPDRSEKWLISQNISRSTRFTYFCTTPSLGLQRHVVVFGILQTFCKEEEEEERYHLIFAQMYRFRIDFD